MRLTSICLLVFLSACIDRPAVEGPTGRLSIATAPLSLPGVEDVCFDLAVKNASGDVVFSRGVPATPAWSGGAALDTASLCSKRFGSGAGGDITFVGTCDASPTQQNHTITLWVDGLYGAALAPLEFQDPCPSGCALTATCVENADTPVTFDLTISRPANQGFFDIAVEFDDLFCSAKYDCQTRALLNDASGARGPTQVIGLSCAAGKAGVDTALYMSDLVITCGSASFTLDPSAGPGNLCTTPGDLASCVGLSTTGSLANPPIFQVATYRPEITPAAAVTGWAWNLALGVIPANLTGCTLSLSATADNHDATGGADGGVIPAGIIYPEIRWNVDLGTCATNQPLDGPGSAVATHYVGPALGTSYAHGHPFPVTAAVVDIANCADGGLDNMGTYKLCEGEDWTLPSSVASSPTGTVTTYTSNIKDEVTRNLSGGGYNAFSRRLTGFDTATNLCELESAMLLTSDTATNGVLGNGLPSAWDSLLDNMNKVDCAELHIEDEIRSLIAAADVCVGTGIDPYQSCRSKARSSLVTRNVIQSYSLGTSLRFGCKPTYLAAFRRRALNFGLWGQQAGNIDGTCTFTPTASVSSLSTALSAFVLSTTGLAMCSGTTPNSALNTSLSGWSTIGDKACGNTTYLEQDWTKSYDFTDPDFSTLFLSRVSALGDRLALDPATESSETFADLVKGLTINGEDGNMPYFEDWGFILPSGMTGPSGAAPRATTQDIAATYGAFANALLTEGVDPNHIRLNLAQGGRIFQQNLELAAAGEDGVVNGPADAYGVGSHGPSVLLNYRFLQHLDRNVNAFGHLEYDTSRRGFRLASAPQFGSLYTDLENLDATTHTAGQYHMFRIAALASVALGFDTVIVTGGTIPSLGLAQTYAGSACPGARWCNYNHAAAAPQGAVDLLAWLRKSIGRLGTDRVEAWCWLGEIGRETSASSTAAFYSRAAANRASYPNARYGTDDTLFRPLQRYFGSGCDLSASDPGTPTLPLSPARIGVSSANELVQNGQGASFAHREWTGLTQSSAVDYASYFSSTGGSVSSWLAMLAGLSWPYEARSPATGGKIRFDIDPTVLGAATAVDVFVVFEKVGALGFNVALTSDGVAWTSPGLVEPPVADDLEHTARLRLTRTSSAVATTVTLDLTEVRGDLRVKLVRVVPQ